MQVCPLEYSRQPSMKSSSDAVAQPAAGAEMLLSLAVLRWWPGVVPLVPPSRGYPQASTLQLPATRAQELSSLFLFSFLLSLSTRFLCIFSASFSYLSFSSLAARFSLIWVARLCTSKAYTGQ